MLRPLDSLGDQTRLVTAGEFDRPIEPVGPPEIMTVAADTEAMRRRIRAELAAMEEAREQLAAQAEELARSNADLEQFAYVASHDLQEPLRKVTSFCQLLQRRYQGQLDERADQYIEFAVDGAKRMQALINDLLAFSRVGRTTEAFVAGRLRRGARPGPAQPGDAPSTTPGRRWFAKGPLPTVEGDPSLLAALFQNVVSNALKFRSDAPPRVEISAAQLDGEWSFRVADNGIGIDEAYAERVFVIFQRLHAKELYPGTGIGLALCKKIVEFHGGRIWIDTDVPEGTAVCWTLPVHHEEPEEEPKKKKKETPLTDDPVDGSRARRDPAGGGRPRRRAHDQGGAGRRQDGQRAPRGQQRRGGAGLPVPGGRVRRRPPARASSSWTSTCPGWTGGRCWPASRTTSCSAGSRWWC